MTFRSAVKFILQLLANPKIMLQVFLIGLAIFYLTIASCLYTQWIKIMEREVCTKVQILFYKLFLIVATILWPIVVPLAYLELLSKQNSKKESIETINDTDLHSVVETDAVTCQVENSVLLLSGHRGSCA